MPGLYIHIPFCAAACPYCDFAFVVGRDGQTRRYVDAVVRELTVRIGDVAGPLDTIYFGGGTPSAVAPADLGRILETVRRHTAVDPAVEITAEANPNDRGRFPALRDVGIDRLSLGIQSTDDRTLAALGRTHTGEDAAGAVSAAREAGFGNVNVDAIFGAPSQTLADWRRDLGNLLALDPDHVSIYGLTVEPSTPFAKRRARGNLHLPCEDTQSAMYDVALDMTERAGLLQYEISNFARPGRESRHNLACWRGDTYTGIGMSAHSYDGGTRTWNARTLNAYLRAVEGGASPQAGTEEIEPATRDLERIMLGLRTSDGIDDVRIVRSSAARRLLSENLIEQTGRSLRLTRRGKHVADLVCAELVRDL